MATEFNAITFTGDKTQGANGYVKYRKISSIERHIKFIESKYPRWVFMNVYNRETNEKTTIKKSALHLQSAKT